MKRIRLFLLAAVMLLSFVGCGADHPDAQEGNFSFSYNGTAITLGAEAAPILDALGEPRSYTEEPSCAFDGMDKTYFYGSFYLSTYPMDGGDHIYRIWFVDDSVETEEGIRIGSAREQVEAVYGTGSIGQDNTCIQDRGDSRLTILLTEGVVSSIQYERVF